jgi:hypothetical protein
MYNQQFWQAEAEQRAQRLLWEAEAERRAIAARLRRRGAESLGKRMLSAIGAQFSRRRGRGDMGFAGMALQASAEGEALADLEALADSGAVIAEGCCEPVAP